jgi:small-conductance mechanosensitive channel
MTNTIIDFINEQLPVVSVILSLIILIFLINFTFRKIKKRLLIHAKSKAQVSNIKIFTRIMNVGLSLVIVLFAFFTYIGSWTSLGIVAGLLTAALGFALQKPITGIAAWIMVIMKRPFNIGDRIKIGDIKGEVYDISLTHIYIDEVGGLINGEELSGRNVMVPNYLLFEQNIINYTLLNDYVIGEVTTSITYESNIKKALSIIEKVTLAHVKEHVNIIKKEPKIRVSMEYEGLKIKSRFFAPVKLIQKISSDITKDIIANLKKQKDIKFASGYTQR